MAGKEGARALSMMNDPQEQARTAKWMDMFKTTEYADREWYGGQMAMQRQAAMQQQLQKPSAEG